MDTYKDLLKAGDVFFIPLTIDFNEKPNKSYSRNKFSTNEEYVFGRFIEDRKGSGVLIEVFSKKTSLNDFNHDKVVNSGNLFPPICVSGIEFTKKRWRVLASNSDYDKVINSNYNEIQFVLNPYDSPKLLTLSNKLKQEIHQKEVNDFEIARIWLPNQVEQRIKDSL